MRIWWLHSVNSGSYNRSIEEALEKRKRLSLKRPQKPTLDSTLPLVLKPPENEFAFTSAEAVEEAQKGFVTENTKKATEWSVRVFPFTSTEAVEEAQKGFVPENTKKATEWSVRVFHTWQVARNSTVTNDQCPDDVLTEDSWAFSKWICYFCTEVHKTNGEPYTPRTILQILAGLLRYMREQKKHAINIRTAKLFLKFTNCLTHFLEICTLKEWEQTGSKQKWSDLMRKNSFGQVAFWALTPHWGYLMPSFITMGLTWLREVETSTRGWSSHRLWLKLFKILMTHPKE